MTVTASVAMEEAAFLMSPPWFRKDASRIWDYISVGMPDELFTRRVWQQIPLERTDFPTREDKVQEACWNTGAHGRRPFIRRIYVRHGSPSAPQYDTYGVCSVEVCSRAEYDAKTPQERTGWSLFPSYANVPKDAEWRIWEVNMWYVSAVIEINAMYRAQQAG